jgi:hypothetical protein
MLKDNNPLQYLDVIKFPWYMKCNGITCRVSAYIRFSYCGISVTLASVAVSGNSSTFFYENALLLGIDKA